MNKHILLIAYVFPPTAGIGGRRWAKFAKYLVNKGYTIHVITSENTTELVSEWAKDVKHSQIIIHNLKAKYPNILNKVPRYFFEKIEYRLWIMFFKIASKGTLYDRSFFWKKQLTQKSASLINEFQIKNVIVTIPPFKLAHHLVAIKKKIPHINLIVDYRDPWTDNQSFHGFKNLSNRRLKHEVKIENEVLRVADKIITVADNMTDTLIIRNKVIASKVVTIQNGFDEDDVVFQLANVKLNDKIKFIYAGSLYSNLDYVIKPLLAELKQIKHNNKELYQKLEFSFYGNQDAKLKQLIVEADLDIITVFGQVPLQDVFQYIHNADYCMLFSAPDHAFAFNTKFFEYLSARKPIVLFSNNGETSDFILKNKLGVLISAESFPSSFQAFINQIENQTLSFNTDFDISKYTIKEITNKVEALLE